MTFLWKTLKPIFLQQRHNSSRNNTRSRDDTEIEIFQPPDYEMVEYVLL